MTEARIYKEKKKSDMIKLVRLHTGKEPREDETSTAEIQAQKWRAKNNDEKREPSSSDGKKDNG